MNRLTSCRAFLLDALTSASPIPVKAIGDTAATPARLYAEIRIDGPRSRPRIDSEFTVNILVIAIPKPETNAYQYIDTANHFSDVLSGMAVTVTNVGCLIQNGAIIVKDFEFVDLAKTIQQAAVTCKFVLEE